MEDIEFDDFDPEDEYAFEPDDLDDYMHSTGRYSDDYDPDNPEDGWL
jgi:hypothetical protein